MIKKVNPQIVNEINKIKYSKCLAFLIAFDQKVDIPKYSFFEDDAGDLSTLFCGITFSNYQTNSVVVRMSNKWSEINFEYDKETIIRKCLLLLRKKITHLYFYWAGCGTEPPRVLIKKVFESIFSNASITIKEDTYAAVYACSDKGEKSIVSIIGTGSNCTYFDGEKIIQKVTSLGYILMDDASGNYFGRQLIRDYFFEKMPSYVSKEFYRKYRLDASEVKDRLYKQPNPNTYLAKFAKFIIENKDLN